MDLILIDFFSYAALFAAGSIVVYLVSMQMRNKDLRIVNIFKEIKKII